MARKKNIIIIIIIICVTSVLFFYLFGQGTALIIACAYDIVLRREK